MDHAQIKHDFLNNCIRIEVIQKMLAQSLEDNKEIDEKHRSDLIDFLKMQIELTSKL